MKLTIHYKDQYKTPNSDVYWFDKNGDRRGSGFLTADMSVALTRCPECLKENYAMSVLSGFCSWCQFDAMSTVVQGEH